MSDVTQILSAIEQGDPSAADQLLPLVYEELRKLAAAKMSQEAPGQTLQATALVHEAYLRLVDVEKARHWNSRAHFFRAAAEAMRCILVDRARRKRSLKRGGDLQRVDLDAVEATGVLPVEDVLEISEALDKLALHDADKAELVKLRYFVGMSVQEAANVLGISRATADRHWGYARFQRVKAQVLAHPALFASQGFAAAAWRTYRRRRLGPHFRVSCRESP